MYLMYVDESGDPGILDESCDATAQPSIHYILTGLIVADVDWKEYLSALVEIRRNLRRVYGYPIRDELKGSELINPRDNEALRTLNRQKRTELYYDFLNSMTLRLNRARVLNVHVNKAQPKYHATTDSSNIEEWAWKCFIQRFENFLKKDGSQTGIIFADDTNEVKIRRLLRTMRHYNPIPRKYGNTYSAPVANIIEDPVMRDSKQSYFVQVSDMIAHSLYRKLYPKGGYRRYNVDRLFDLVDPVLLKQASVTDSQGIVHL
ncbi:MAG TPA: DUF3800 domain-containing protein [Firmicutes bacterium]|nr:DUF3800 domain-containing protein [Bacillota bacterium]